MRFSGVGYHGATFRITAEAVRESVIDLTAPDGEAVAVPPGGICQTFTPGHAFNRVGLLASVSPPEVSRNVEASLTLERWDGSGWTEIRTDWYSHVRDGQWIWVVAEEMLPAGERFRIRLHTFRAPDGATLALKSHSEYALGDGEATLGEGATASLEADLALRVDAETTRLTVESTYNPNATSFALSGRAAGSTGTLEEDGGVRLETTLLPGEEVLLQPGMAAGGGA